MARHPVISVLIVLSVLLLGEAALSYVFYHGLTRDHPGANDFYVPWFASHALWLQGRDPYSSEVTRDMHAAFAFDTTAHSFSFAYPLYATFLIAPLTPLPYAIASAIWLALTLSFMLGAGLLTLRNLDLTLQPLPLMAFALWWLAFYPVTRTLFLGQLAAVVLACIVGAWWCIRNRNDWLAGSLLALATIKPQMLLLLLPLILLWAWQQRRRGVWLGFGLTLSILCLASFAILPSWLWSFIQTARTYAGYFDSHSPLQILLPNDGLSFLIALLLIGLLGYAAWRATRQSWSAQWRIACWSIILTQLVALHTATTNQIMLIIPICAGLLPSNSRTWTRWVNGLWLGLLLIVPWWIFLVTKDGNLENEVALLPLSLGVLGWWVWLGLRRQPKDAHS